MIQNTFGSPTTTTNPKTDNPSGLETALYPKVDEYKYYPSAHLGYNINGFKYSKDQNYTYQKPAEPVGEIKTLKRSVSEDNFHRNISSPHTTCITGSGVLYSRTSVVPARWYYIQSNDRRGQIQRVQRRYTDFETLHNFLISKHPNKYIMCPFPQAFVSEKFTDRSFELQRYLKFVTENFFCEELLNWLTLQTFSMPQIEKNLIGSLTSSVWQYFVPQTEKTQFDIEVKDKFMKMVEVSKSLAVLVQERITIEEVQKTSSAQIECYLGQLGNRQLTLPYRQDTTTELHKVHYMLVDFNNILESSVALSIARNKNQNVQQDAILKVQKQFDSLIDKCYKKLVK